VAAVEIDVTRGVDSLKDLGKALKKEADGKAMRRDLIKRLKVPLAPAVAEIKSGLMSMGSSGPPAKGAAKTSLRAQVARKIRPEVKLSGFRAGVRVKASKTPAIRGFANAPKRLNSPKGWRRPVYGNRQVWVVQYGQPGYFDDPLLHRRDEFRTAVVAAMGETADRIASNAKRAG
jgi:hypothetical protein